MLNLAEFLVLQLVPTITSDFFSSHQLSPLFTFISIVMLALLDTIPNLLIM